MTACYYTPRAPKEPSYATDVCHIFWAKRLLKYKLLDQSLESFMAGAVCHELNTFQTSTPAVSIMFLHSGC